MISETADPKWAWLGRCTNYELDTCASAARCAEQCEWCDRVREAAAQRRRTKLAWP